MSDSCLNFSGIAFHYPRVKTGKERRDYQAVACPRHCATYFIWNHYQKALVACVIFFIDQETGAQKASTSLMLHSHIGTWVCLTLKAALPLSLEWTVSSHNPGPYSMPQMSLVISGFLALLPGPPLVHSHLLLPSPSDSLSASTCSLVPLVWDSWE